MYVLLLLVMRKFKKINILLIFCTNIKYITDEYLPNLAQMFAECVTQTLLNI